MTQEHWKVEIISQAKKADKYLSKAAIKAFAILLDELIQLGPYRANWPNYTKMPKDEYHCHLKKGRPTYVACWRVFKNSHYIEVFYAGTHENAPY